jgi:hypothetical protein
LALKGWDIHQIHSQRQISNGDFSVPVSFREPRLKKMLEADLEKGSRKKRVTMTTNGIEVGIIFAKSRHIYARLIMNGETASQEYELHGGIRARARIIILLSLRDLWPRNIVDGTRTFSLRAIAEVRNIEDRMSLRRRYHKDSGEKAHFAKAVHL